MGGHHYLETLKVPLPQVRMIASGGVNQQTAFDFIWRALTARWESGEQLMPQEALFFKRKETQIHELARRFLGMVKDARAQKGNKA